MIRTDGRRPQQIRPVSITPGYLAHAEGSALIKMGGTAVLCAVSVEDRVPRFAIGSGSGWITAEYGMLPRSTHTRTPREQSGRSGRTAEIQRLIGRSLRSVARLDLLGERTYTVDCDVLEADGGTRTASITGAYVALVQAMQKLVEAKAYPTLPVHCAVAAVSAGIVDAMPLLDLAYEEDSRAAADFNVVATEAGELVEVQGTGEHHPFTRAADGRAPRPLRSGPPRALRSPEAGVSRHRHHPARTRHLPLVTLVATDRPLCHPARNQPRYATLEFARGIWGRVASRASQRTPDDRCCSLAPLSGRSLRVLPQERPADDMHVPVLLGLHRVVAEVREQPEPPRAVLLPHPHRELADAPHVLPQLRLRHVPLRHRQQHHRHPAQPVAEHHHLVVLVEDVRRLLARDDVAEHA